MQPNVSKSWGKYKQAYHTCANHLGGPPVSTSSCDIIVHLAGAMSGKNLTVRSHVRHQMMHLQKEEDVNYPLVSPKCELWWAVSFITAIVSIQSACSPSFGVGLFCNQAQLTRYHCPFDTKNFHSLNI